MDHFVRNRRHAFTGERLFAGGHPVQNHAERKNIRAAIHRRARKLLRRHERRSAQHLAGHGGLAFGELRDAEVRNFRPLDAVNFTRSHQDIRGLDIAVNHAVVVRVPERLRDFLADLAHAIEIHTLAGFRRVRQRFSGDEFHYEIRYAFVLAYVEYRNYSRMRECSGRARLPEKSLASFSSFIAAEQNRSDRLQRNDAIHGRILAPVYRAHGAVTQLRHDFVPSDFFRCVHSRKLSL